MSQKVKVGCGGEEVEAPASHCVDNLATQVFDITDPTTIMKGLVFCIAIPGLMYYVRGSSPQKMHPPAIQAILCASLSLPSCTLTSGQPVSMCWS